MSQDDTLQALVRRDMPRLTPDMPIRRAVAILLEQRSAAAPVVDDSGALRGILSQKDCFRPSLNASYYQEWKGTVADFMSADVATLPASLDVIAAAEAFLSQPYRSFPVLDGEQLIGMVRRSDVLKRLVELG
ncbi:CBS domain-containing protein [Paracoccus seriniphilus]|uniref:CBS domain-containing protein n=1 Tax=Paracoccus seriniphilus TaxID=184748 RepID=A0A239PUY1_9RHOB|nr:CBS domain-containing protein [Paracoccus seriniphilus]WCR15355.1 CBS domain-containing protein [Paracoccus seriniphilus]SNT73833.1 CBS domain-containing protein [Paracoccus seriniphilus]